jgi:putative addiction module component (TIGR02574 family)
MKCDFNPAFASCFGGASCGLIKPRENCWHHSRALGFFTACRLKRFELKVNQMTTTAEKLKTELVELPAHDRANLAHFLIQSLPLPPAMTEREFDAELEKRAREIQEGKAKGEPVEKVIAELREKFS